MKIIIKALTICFIIIAMLIIASFFYIGTPKIVNLNNINDEQKNIILKGLNLQYIPKDIEIISIEVPKINIGPYYYINYSINSSEKEKFVKENNINKRGYSDIKEIKEKENKIYYNQILTQENDLKGIERVIKEFI